MYKLCLSRTLRGEAIFLSSFFAIVHVLQSALARCHVRENSKLEACASDNARLGSARSFIVFRFHFRNLSCLPSTQTGIYTFHPPVKACSRQRVVLEKLHHGQEGFDTSS